MWVKTEVVPVWDLLDGKEISHFCGKATFVTIPKSSAFVWVSIPGRFRQNSHRRLAHMAHGQPRTSSKTSHLKPPSYRRCRCSNLTRSQLDKSLRSSTLKTIEERGLTKPQLMPGSAYVIIDSFPNEPLTWFCSWKIRMDHDSSISHKLGCTSQNQFWGYVTSPHLWHIICSEAKMISKQVF